MDGSSEFGTFGVKTFNLGSVYFHTGSGLLSYIPVCTHAPENPHACPVPDAGATAGHRTGVLLPLRGPGPLHLPEERH